MTWDDSRWVRIDVVASVFWRSSSPLWSGWRCRARGGYFSSGFARRGRGGACRGPRRCPRPSTCGARRRRGVAHVLVSASRRRHDVDNEECRDAEVVGRGQARASADRDAGRHHRARASLPAAPLRRARCGRWRTRCAPATPRAAPPRPTGPTLSEDVESHARAVTGMFMAARWPTWRRRTPPSRAGQPRISPI